MKRLIQYTIFLLMLFPILGYAQAELKTSEVESISKADEEMKLRIECFENAVNDVLRGKTLHVQLDPFIMNSEDIDFWMGQFQFTEDVLKEITPEAFYNKLEGWAGSARQNFSILIADMDRFVISDHQFQYGSDPGLRVNRSANLLVYLYKNEEYVSSIKLTLIDIQGQLKLIQAN